MKQVRYVVFTIIFVLQVIIGNVCNSKEFRPVSEMGDIWIITIDKSGSMLNNTRPGLIGADVYRRILDCSKFSSIDFCKDRFIFLTSGYNWSDNIGLGNELKNSGPFDESFIHFTDNLVHTFGNKEECATYIKDLISKNDYTHRLSFVSQIRVFSIIHAVNLLKEQHLTDTFNNLMVLTITDDADQNDQWMLDYRNLKKWASCKVQEVNDSTSKYIYNSFYGRGLGNLDEIYSDEKNIPHLWIYRYQTLESSDPCIERDVLKVGATDGKNIGLSLKDHSLDGNYIEFVHVDSIIINKHSILVDSSFERHFEEQHKYSNSFRLNNIAISGYVQVRYNDPIYGQHYKQIQFIQYETVKSNALATLITVAIIICLIAIIGVLMYLFIIRPRFLLFTVYSGAGAKTDVYRGFSKNWKGDTIPIQCYEEGCDGGILEPIIKHHGNIHVEDIIMPDSSHACELLIVSHHPISISVETKNVTTAEDIERMFYLRSGLYPFLLRNHYQTTLFYRLYKKYSESGNSIHRKFLKCIIKIGNILCETYYYSIDSIELYNKIYIGVDFTLKNKRFLLEYKHFKEVEPRYVDDIVNCALSIYYSSRGLPVYDIIIASKSMPDRIYWAVIKLDGGELYGQSLRKVQLVEIYREDGLPQNVHDGFNILFRYFKKVFRTSRIGHIDVVSGTGLFDFEIRRATAPGFISFCEMSDAHRSQILYSPVEDFESKEKFVRINRKYCNGNLVLSLVPVKYIRDRKSFVTNLSSSIIENNVNTSNLLTLKEDSFEFRGITEKYQ